MEEGTMPVKDPIGDRMKRQYENRARFYLTRRSFTIIRIDGKSFHTWTKGLERPYDVQLTESMASAAGQCFRDFMGCKLAYGQSDEYSFVLTDFDKIETEAWFDGNMQKMASVASSTFTAHFNKFALVQWPNKPPAIFDARVFQIPDYEEVLNYFVWRQQDAERNSLSMLAQANYSHKQLHGKGRVDLHELLHAKGVNWALQPDSFKRGTVLYREGFTGQLLTVSAPIFTQSRSWMKQHIPEHWQEDRIVVGTV